MSGIRFEQIGMLNGLWLLPVLAALFLYAAQQRKKALRAFIDAGLIGRVPLTVSAVRRRWKAAMVLAAYALIVIGLARPAWNPKAKTIERKGRDIVFVLDVSKSMLAEDLKPNRLERAKLAIRDCLEQLQGDRVALVVFAGKAVVKCPLTLDYGFFRMMLDQVDVNSVSRGGTMIGDALRTTLDDVFDDQQKEYKDIILITDGEDHDSFPVEAAKRVGERGIRLLIVGLGDEGEGRRIPITDASGHKRFLTYHGREVWSRLDADTLRKMANATPGGRYLNVATGTVDLGQVYMQLIAGEAKKTLESKTIKQYEEKFQIFLSAAFVLLGLERLISDRAKKQTGA